MKRNDITIDGYKPKEGDSGYHRAYYPNGYFTEIYGKLKLRIPGYGIEEIKDSIYLNCNLRKIIKPGPWLIPTKKEYLPE